MASSTPKSTSHTPLNIDALEPTTAVGLMYPHNEAATYPVVPMLLRYAKSGYPVDAGPNWKVPEMLAAVDQGPHQSALSPEAMTYSHQEAEEKLAGGFATIVLWDDIKVDPPKT